MNGIIECFPLSRMHNIRDYVRNSNSRIKNFFSLNFSTETTDLVDIIKNGPIPIDKRLN